MYITVCTKDNIVVDTIDVPKDEWDFDKPIGRAALVDEILVALRRAKNIEEEK